VLRQHLLYSPPYICPNVDCSIRTNRSQGSHRRSILIARPQGKDNPTDPKVDPLLWPLGGQSMPFLHAGRPPPPGFGSTIGFRANHPTMRRQRTSLCRTSALTPGKHISRCQARPTRLAPRGQHGSGTVLWRVVPTRRVNGAASHMLGWAALMPPTKPPRRLSASNGGNDYVIGCSVRPGRSAAGARAREPSG
jgi:hypothetical protein